MRLSHCDATIAAIFSTLEYRIAAREPHVLIYFILSTLQTPC